MKHFLAVFTCFPVGGLFGQPTFPVNETAMFPVSCTAKVMLDLHFFLCFFYMLWAVVIACNNMQCKRGYKYTCNQFTVIDVIQGMPIHGTGGPQGNKLTQSKTVSPTGKKFAV